VLSNFQLFKKQLDESLDLIDAALGADGGVLFDLSENIESFPDTLSLLARCESVCKKYEKGKPIIRIIHHFACSGGSLISKCISAMPNVFLLSEVHPHSELYLLHKGTRYLPSDIGTLAKYSGIPSHVELAKRIFSQSIKVTHEHVSKLGGSLVLRDHSHSDFCIDLCNSEKKAVVDSLRDDFVVVSLITLRDPVDSFMSLVKNGWTHFSPPGFDEYCRRLLDFINAYPEADIVLYEDLVSKPTETLQLICLKLDLGYNEMFESIFDCFNVTGDSGRTGAVISNRERRPLSTKFEQEIQTSKNYEKFIIYIEERLSLPSNRTNYVKAENLKK
jgi:hypothetical protein